MERPKRKWHGHSTSPEYASWKKMLQRCNNPKHINYKYYGALGVTVCERWHYFPYFWKDMGPKPSPEYSIDRIDANGNYEPGNCRWATREMQSNNRRNSRFLTFRGKTQTRDQWAKEFGIHPMTLMARLRQGATVEEALLRPLHRGKKPSQRLDARMVTHNGKTQSVSDWEREYGLKIGFVGRRLRNGWSMEEALRLPSQKGKKDLGSSPYTN